MHIRGGRTSTWSRLDSVELIRDDAGRRGREGYQCILPTPPPAHSPTHSPSHSPSDHSIHPIPPHPTPPRPTHPPTPPRSPFACTLFHSAPEQALDGDGLVGTTIREGTTVTLPNGVRVRCLLAQPGRQGRVTQATRLIVTPWPADLINNDDDIGEDVDETTEDHDGLVSMGAAAAAGGLHFADLLPAALRTASSTAQNLVTVTVAPARCPPVARSGMAAAVYADTVWVPPAVLLALGCPRGSAVRAIRARADAKNVH